VAASSSELVKPRRQRTLERLTSISARSVRGRVMVVSRAGRVLADSAGTSSLGADYASRPEVAAALNGRSYQATRESQTLGAELLATAVPIVHRGRPIGAVRITQSVDAVTGAIHHAYLGLGLLAAIVLALALIAGALIAQQIARPIRRLDIAAHQVSAGDLEARAPVEGSAEQRSLARSFNRMTTRVSRLLRSQQEFVADASHQLRTPLAGLRLQLEELRADLVDGDPRNKRLVTGLAEIDRLSHIVDELLILSRAGEHELPGERIDLGEAANQAVERWSKAAVDQRIELQFSSQDGPATAWCAWRDLDRALDSLIENAIHYSPPSSSVSVVARPGGVDILDQGPGLEPDEETTVFERFFRGSAGRAGPPGTGLGLAIARELIGQWGGSVSLTNRHGGGARATLELPADRSADGERYGGAR
jgi:two-component system, OmpR family, sensor kinase